MQRWDIEDYYETFEVGSADKVYVRNGSFIDHIDLFDNSLFGLSQLESISMDPQQRLLLEEIFSLMQGQIKSETFTGVYVGCMYHEYLQLHVRCEKCASTLAVTGNGANYMVARICYTFNFQGPAISTDTACSSSLVSFHQAGCDIKYDLVAASLVAGTNLMLLASTFQGICQLKALSKVGRCQTFDANADGYGRGEAVLVGYLSPRPASTTEGFVIKASAINQDGRSNGLTAPNGTSQQALLKMNLSKVERPGSFCMQSLHGTGTTLGDPIEVSAIRKSILDIRYCSIVSLVMESSKSILGHTEGAAGMAGVALSMTYLEVSIKTKIGYLRRLNPFVRSSIHEYSFRPILPLASSPACLPSEAHAATSSFGMGGTNAHAILGFLGGHYFDKKVQLEYFKSSHWPIIQIHPLIRDCFIHSNSVLDYGITLACSDNSTLLHHKVQNRALIPAAFFLCLSASITSTLTSGNQKLLKDALFVKPALYPETIEKAYLSVIVDRVGRIRAIDTAGDSLFISRAALQLSHETTRKLTSRLVRSARTAKIYFGRELCANIIAQVKSGWEINEDLQAVTSSDCSFHLAGMLSDNFQTYVPSKLGNILLEDCVPEAVRCFVSSSVTLHSEFETSLSDIRLRSCGKVALQASDLESKKMKARGKPMKEIKTSSFKVPVDSQGDGHSMYVIWYSVCRPLTNTLSYCNGLDITLPPCAFIMKSDDQSTSILCKSLSLIREYVSDKRNLETDGQSRIQQFTQNALPYCANQRPNAEIKPVRSSLWGLFRVARSELGVRINFADTDSTGYMHCDSEDLKEEHDFGTLIESRCIRIPSIELAGIRPSKRASRISSYNVVLGGTKGMPKCMRIS